MAEHSVEPMAVHSAVRKAATLVAKMVEPKAGQRADYWGELRAETRAEHWVARWDVHLAEWTASKKAASWAYPKAAHLVCY